MTSPVNSGRSSPVDRPTQNPGSGDGDPITIENSRREDAPDALFQSISALGENGLGVKVIAQLKGRVLGTQAKVEILFRAFVVGVDPDEMFQAQFTNNLELEKGISIWAEVAGPLYTNPELSEDEKKEIISDPESEGYTFPLVTKYTIFAFRKSETSEDLDPISSNQFSKDELTLLESIEKTMETIFPNLKPADDSIPE